MKKIIFTIALITSVVACSKPEDYCEELYKSFYYDFERKEAMVETINACYEY